MSKTRIFIVEDENIVAKDLQKRLTALGYQVLGIVASGEEAIKKIATLKPDMVLMDIRLKGPMDGIEAAAHVHERYGTPVIYLTAYADNDTLRRASVTEPFGYILKPFDEREIHTTIEMALYRKEVERKLRENEHWFATTLRSIGDAVIATDSTGIIRFMNTAAESFTGWKMAEAVGQDLSAVFRTAEEAGKSKAVNPVHAVLKGKVTAVLKNRATLIARDGKRIPIDENASPIKDEQGTMIGVVLVFQDTTERKRTQEALRTSQQFSDHIVDSSMDMIIAVDLDRKIIEFNKAAERAFGYAREDVLGQHIDLLYANPGEGSQINLQTLEKGVGWGEIYNRRKNGELFPVRLTSSVLLNARGEKIGFMGISRDITDIKRAEEALRASQEYAQNLIDSSLDMIIATDEHRKIIEFNHAAETAFGYSAVEILGKTTSVLFADDEVALRVHTTTLEQGRCVQEVLNKRKNGESFPSLISSSLLKDTAGNTIGVMGVSRDITERKKAEGHLQENERRYREIFENANDIIYTHDLDGNFTSLNAAAERLTGYSRDEVGSLNIRSIVAPEYLDLALSMMKKKLKGESTQPYEIEIVAKSGKRLRVELNTRLNYHDGKPEGVQGIVRDVTERRQAEETLRQSEQHYRRLVELSPEPIVVHSDGKLVFVNSAAAELVHADSPQQLIGRSVFDFVHPDSRQTVLDRVQEMMRTRENAPVISERFIRLDGKIIEVEVAAMPFTWQQRPAIQVVMRDITERKRAEQALRASETKYRSLFENVFDGVYQSTPDGEILTVNPALARMLGYESEAALLVADIRRDLYADPAQRKQSIRRLEADGILLNNEVALRRKDGSILTAIENARVILSRSGDVLYYEGTLTDITERKRAQEALQRSEERFRVVAETARCAIFIYRGERFVYVNPETERILGYSSQELLRMNFWEIMHPDFRELTRERASARQRGEEVLDRYHIKIIAKSGDEKWVDFSASYFEYEGEPAALGTAIEVTEQRRSELLQEAVYEIAQAADTAADLQELYGSVHNIISKVMPAENFYISLYDADEDLLSFPYFVDQFDPPMKSRKPGKGLTGYVLRTGVSLLCKEETDRELQRRGEVEVVGHPSPVWLGVPLIVGHRTIGVMAVQHYEDPDAYTEREQRMLEFVSSQVAKAIDRKQSLQALAESEARYRAYFEGDLAGHFISKRDGTILACNPAFARIFGFNSADEAVGRNASQVYLSSASREEFIALLEKKKRLENYELTLRRIDGTVIHVVENVLGEFDEDGTLLMIKGVMLDVTAQRNLEEKMRQTQKMESIGTLAGGIAHDFNNILTIINGYASLMRKDGTDASKYREWIDMIVRSVERGAAVVRQLNTFAKENNAEFSPVDLNKVVHEVLNLLKETFPQNIEFKLSLAASPPAVFGDFSQVHQALLNLLVNARDACERGGTITIRTAVVEPEAMVSKFPDADADRYLMLEVEDTGTGIRNDVKDRMFEPFFTTKEIGKGSGLGLAVVYGVVRGHKGHIDVATEMGKGTSVRIYWPATAAPAPRAESHAPDITQFAGNNETVMLVEDEENLLSLLQLLLESNGYRVVTAMDGAEALEVYKREHQNVAVVLSDMGLPKLGGWEVFVEMKKMNPAVKTILASGYLDVKLREDMIRSGAKDFIQKPYMPDAILRRIREVIDGTQKV